LRLPVWAEPSTVTLCHISAPDRDAKDGHRHDDK
jgi:hypothetical protein